jgi:hypothetical protein
MMRFTILLFLLLTAVVANVKPGGAHNRHHGGVPKGKGGTGGIALTKSVTKTNKIDEPGKFSVISMHLQHHADTSWHVPSLHDKYSWGWNRTFVNEKMLRPHACTLKFYAMGLESTVEDFMAGGTGYLGIEVKGKGKPQWYGFDKSDKWKLHCYYMTNKGYGSEFVDDPKTLAFAVYCPVPLDVEVGAYEFRKIMEPGYFCRNFADVPIKAELYLRPSNYNLVPNDGQEFLVLAQNSTILNDSIDVAAKNIENKQIVSDFVTAPTAARTQDIRLSEALDPRPHAICTVQTFRNAQSGPMLYAFIKYHIDLGWRVIVYDRFGLHKEYLKDLEGIDGLDYHPFTVLQMVNPTKYSTEYAASQGSERKVFYQMEKNWGYKGQKADTADQDQDKTKTYDYARIEYAHLDMVLFLDADEFFYCPQASLNIETQRIYQQKIMQQFSSQGIEEMRFVRIPYSGIAVAPVGFNGTKEELWELDFTETTEKCMLDAFAKKDVSEIMRCWSSASAYDNFPKSADFGNVCPFHYNHWSCDGMRNGGRDYVATRCRCKVAFDMINGFEYKPVLDKCHLMHYNDNKYKFQSRREKHVNDKGDIFAPTPIVALLNK